MAPASPNPAWDRMMTLSCAGFRRTQGPSHRSRRARGGDRQVQLQRQHASDPCWKAAKGAGEQRGTPCFRELNAASEGSETELPWRFPGGCPLESSWARPDAAFRTGLLRSREAPLGVGPMARRGFAFPEQLPSQTLLHLLPNFAFTFWNVVK